ncbi:hemin-degrading factor [Mesorhizobium sp. M6A.T.Ca.TU.002.02.2.1]|nr:hemin-degrading factor [Mesorhizobium sp. M6A.T.Ca.TU.002.02.2.1]
MDQRKKRSPNEIRRAWEVCPNIPARDFAAQLAISEAELVAAHCGFGAARIDPRVNHLLTGLEFVGEVTALTRNQGAVHEKIGVFNRVITGNNHAMVLGDEFDLRVFPQAWRYGFAVERRHRGGIQRSLQFFDATGAAVHKVHLRPVSNLHAYRKLVAELVSANQEPTMSLKARVADLGARTADWAGTVDDLREHWSRLTDVNLLKTLKLGRCQALRMVGQDYAWLLDNAAVGAVLQRAAEDELPIMCFVGNRGSIQTHSGLIKSVKQIGPCIYVLDETFRLHLRTHQIREVWAVRKPTNDSHVTSLEAYGSDGKIIIQLFGARKEGERERDDWRVLAENLPRFPDSYMRKDRSSSVGRRRPSASAASSRALKPRSGTR